MLNIFIPKKAKQKKERKRGRENLFHFNFYNTFMFLYSFTCFLFPSRPQPYSPIVSHCSCSLQPCGRKVCNNSKSSSKNKTIAFSLLLYNTFLYQFRVVLPSFCQDCSVFFCSESEE